MTDAFGCKLLGWSLTDSFESSRHLEAAGSSLAVVDVQRDNLPLTVGAHAAVPEGLGVLKRARHTRKTRVHPCDDMVDHGMCSFSRSYSATFEAVVAALTVRAPVSQGG